MSRCRPACCFLALLSFLACGLLPGCGGGGGGAGGSGASQPPSATITLALPSEALVDGYVLGTGQVNTNSIGLAVHDDDGGTACRSFVRFDRSLVPMGATIVQARLRLLQAWTNGDPYKNGAAVLVDHVDLDTGLDSAEYGAPAIMDAVAGSADPANGWKEMDVTDAVQTDHAAGRLHTDFRLRLSAESDADAVMDHVRFTDGGGSPGVGSPPPFLEVTYTMP